MPTPGPGTAVTLFVVNQAFGSASPPSITQYRAGSSGNARPAKTISGFSTLLSDPAGLFVDSRANIFVANFFGGSITEYASGRGGNFPPIADITGFDTGLSFPLAVALDSVGNIYVTNGDPINSVTEYPPQSTGDAVPSATIAGFHTGLRGPNGIAVDQNGNIYVANAVASIAVFSAGSVGDATPAAIIAGGRTGLDAPTGLALDGAGNLYVANIHGDSVTEYAAQSNGDVAPLATISGASTSLLRPIGVAVDHFGNIYVANSGAGTITEYPPHSSGDVAPLVTIAGPATGLVQPASVAVVGTFPAATPTPLPTATPGPPPPGLSVSPTSIDFGVTGAHAAPLRRGFTIANSGDTAIAGNVANSLPRAFKLVKGAGPFRLPPRHGKIVHKKAVAIQFAASSPGTFAGNVNVNTNVPDNSSTSVSVTATAQSGTLTVSGSLDFGKVAVGNSKVLALTIKNKGLGVLHGTVLLGQGRGQQAFEALRGEGDFTLTHGQTMEVSVRFAPPSKSLFRAFVSIVSQDDPAHRSVLVEVSGTGQ